MTAAAEEPRRGPRGATNPARGLTPGGLADLPREERRLLVMALLFELGLTVTDHTPRGDHDELVIGVRPGWRSREGRARIFYSAITQRDVDEFSALAEQGALGEAILIQATDAPAEDFSPPRSVQFIPVNELIERLQESAVVEWEGSVPKHDRTSLARLRSIDSAPAWLDALGLRALPLLARNKLPSQLQNAAAPPDELFERLTFRLLIHVFRFRGRDLGARARAQRAPDAILESPFESPEPFSGVLDCKASRDGFEMSADDETRLCNYVRDHRDELLVPDEPFIVVVSSNFPGTNARYESRRDNVAESCGARLVYWQVEHLVTGVQHLEEQRLDPAEREALPWNAYFATGAPGSDIWSFAKGDQT
jgi:hypothetical protein